MKTLSLQALICLGLFGAGCAEPTNPQTVWLGPGDSEAQVTLVDKEPNPF